MLVIRIRITNHANMTISIRLDEKTEAALRQRLSEEEVPLSEFVREAIREKLARGAAKESPYELGKALFGRYSSGATDRSAHRKQIVRERLNEKYRR